MIEAGEFVARAGERGWDWYAGVPCSFLAPLIDRLVRGEGATYLSSTNEGDAVAAAAGAFLGGRRAVALMQNSGLGNAVNPLTSLAWPFRLPMLLLVGWRGSPDGTDEPQHRLMGRITGRLLEAMEIPWETLPEDGERLGQALAGAEAHFRAEGRPYALLVRRGTLAPGRRSAPVSGSGPRDPGSESRPLPAAGRARRLYRGLRPERRPTRGEALRRIVALTPPEGNVVIATAGHTGRELFSIADRPNQLYMVGSMGCASSLGLGLAMARPELRVVVVDGDGAALMRMGNLATAGAYGSPNLAHVVLDNEMHASTGGQATVSGTVSLGGVAAACGYGLALEGDDLSLLDELLAEPAGGGCGARFLLLKIRRGSPAGLPRPRLPPAAVKERLLAHVGAAP